MINNNKILLVLLIFISGVENSWAATVTTVTSGFNGSGDLLVTADGNIYNANFGLNLGNANGTDIVKITPDGDVTQFATGFQGASGMALDSAGNIIQANIGGNFISQVSPAGVVTTIASQGLNSPVGVAVNSDDEIFVTNCGSSSISQIVDGVAVTFSTSTLFNCPNGLAADDENNLYAVNFNNGVVVKIDTEGNASMLADSGGGNGHIVFGNNRLYFTSHGKRQVFEMSLTGELTVLAGTGVSGHQDGDGSSATFTALNGIGISPDEKIIYVNEPVALGSALAINLNPNVLRAIKLDEENTNDFQINHGLSGAWVDPSLDGQGVVFDFALDENRFDAVMFWFTYDDMPADVDTELTGFGSRQNRWFTAIGPVQGSSIVMPIFRSSGGEFNDPAAVNTVEVGTVEVEFLNCFEALLNFEFVEPEAKTGAMSLQRITPDIMCESLLDTP